MSNLSNKYKKSLEQKWLMRFKTIHPDGDAFDGIVIQNKKNFIVVVEFNNLELDGFVLIPKKVISGYRDLKFEICFNQIIRQNKEFGKIKIPQWIDECDSIQEVLLNLEKRKIWPAIEVIFDEDSAFFIGEIQDVQSDLIKFKSYDAAGKWAYVDTLLSEDIFKIEFNSRYCNHFNTYMKNSNPSQE